MLDPSIPLSEMARLYRDGRSLREVAKAADLSEQTARRRLAGYGVAIRPKWKQLDLLLPIESLAQRYLSGESQNDLAREAGVAPQVLRKRLIAHGVQIRPAQERTPTWSARLSAAQRAELDETRLRDLHSQGLSCAEIGEQMGCSDEVAREALVRLDLSRLAAKARPHKNAFWRGGYTVDRYGYILVHRPDHGHANSGGYVRQHRLVMEQVLQRELGADEVVDHRNGDTSDNRPENLRLFPSNAEHLRVTLKGRKPVPAQERERLRREAVQRACRRIDAILAESGSGADR